ncbi:adhesin [Streptomyces sp. NPDC054888]
MACPVCGTVAGDGRVAGGSWVARETLAGRLSTLSRPRKALLATAVVLAVAVLVTSATLLADPDGDSGGGTGGPAANADDLARGVPTRIGPTGPLDPTAASTARPSSSASASASRSPGPARTTPRPPSKKPKAPDRPPPARHPAYSAWAGPGCSSGHYEEFGRFENGDAGWYTVGSGGYDGASCDGRFTAVPMSGAPDRDRGNTATWSWQVGSGFEECALSVYVPRGHRDTDVAGHPTFYRLLADPDDEDSSYAAFAVRQTAHRGSLVSVGSYEVKGDRFAVQLLDRGRDWGDEELVGAHHAAAQMRLTCRG